MKKLLFIAMAAFATFSVSAREVTEVIPETRTETVADNAGRQWFVSAGVGPQIFIGDHDRQAKNIGELISPALDIAVGKWITPGIGVRLTYSGLQARGVTQTWGNKNGGVHSTGKEVSGKFTHEYGFLCKSKFNFFTLHTDVMFDVFNLSKGYDPDRLYSLIPYAGIGWGHVTSSPTASSFIGNFGLFNAFHITKAIDINIDGRLTLTSDGFDGEKGDAKVDLIMALTAGVTYRFSL